MKNITLTTDSPITIQTEKVLKWWDYPLFLLLTSLSLSAMYYFFSYWFSLNDLMNYPITFSIMTLLLIIILLNNQARWFLLLCMKRPKPMAAKRGWRVGVATTFVPGGESLEMLEKTVKALTDLIYPHDTWVLDEGDDDQVKTLCLRLGAMHFSRKSLRQYQSESGEFQSHSKFGNYNAWLHEVGFDRYEIISAFDPDHIPKPEFLSHVLGYFEDPKVGYVQAAQAYYNQKASFIARGAAEEVYGYYSSIQMANYGLGYPVVIGGHNTHRTTALKQVGGFAAHSADDILITVLYQACGWKGVYVPQILSRGLTPVDWKSYLTQQAQWARSVLDIKFRVHPRPMGYLPFKDRVLSFLNGLHFSLQGINIFAGLMLLSFMLATGIVPAAVSYPTIPRLAILWGTLQICRIRKGHKLC